MVQDFFIPSGIELVVEAQLTFEGQWGSKAVILISVPMITTFHLDHEDA